MSDQFEILHVSQASSGGVLNALVQLANSQAASGARVHVMLSRRDDTPCPEDLRRLFAGDIRLIEAPGQGMNIKSTFALYREIVRAIKRIHPSHIHLHSSFAGAVGRLAALTINRQRSTIYSPHGFSFLRQDVSAGKRRIFALIERTLHSTGSSMALVSPSEREAARTRLSSKRLFVLENGIDILSLPRATREGFRPMVGTAGRVTYAKAPWKFAALAGELEGVADFQWIGGGGTSEADAWISTPAVNVTGWQTEEMALRRIAGLDVYVSTSLWEGLPIAVVQAQALGIPCVVSNCVGNVDVVQHGITGYIAQDDQEMRDYLRQLINDEGLRREFGECAASYAQQRFDSRRLGPTSFQIYSQTTASS